MPLPPAFAPRGVWRALGYRVLWACADACQMAATACLALAAGLLRPDDLRRANLLRWEAFAAASDDADRGLDLWERRLYQQLLRPSDRVLLVGCGTGRDLVGLLELGYQVTGLEPAPSVAERARDHLARRGLAGRVLKGFVETADLGELYDAVLFAPGVYTHIPQSASRVATLARLARHLAPGGRIVLIYPEERPVSPWPARLAAFGARVSGAGWRPDAGDVFWRDHHARRVVRYDHFFRGDDVARECAAAGFRILRHDAVGNWRAVVAVPEGSPLPAPPAE